MKIEDKRTPKVLNTLKVGDVFRFENFRDAPLDYRAVIKDSKGKYLPVLLRNGDYTYSFSTLGEVHEFYSDMPQFEIVTDKVTLTIND